MQKLKKFVKSLIKRDSLLYNIIKKIYHCLSALKYKIKNNKQIKAQNRHYTEQVDKAIEIIKKYKNEDYIVLYNPTWLGVAASTKGLFKNIVPLEQVFGKRNIKRISNAIVESNIKSVIFSQIVDGWCDVLEDIKRLNNNITIKVIWHGNCYEFFSDYTWNLNKNIINLYNEKKVDAFAFVRSTMYEFYKKQGFKCFYLQNNVFRDSNNQNKKEHSSNVKIGIYNADTRELKNIYTSLSAVKLIPNSIADIVPINDGAQKFVDILNLETTSLNNYISNDELMERIQENDINIYPTFTENSPMFPLESFEVGIPCILGNNNDYFCGTELEKYVVLEKEDDSIYIKEKILSVLNNKDEIMHLYKNWKKDFNVKCDELVKDFIND